MLFFAFVFWLVVGLGVWACRQRSFKGREACWWWVMGAENGNVISEFVMFLALWVFWLRAVGIFLDLGVFLLWGRGIWWVMGEEKGMGSGGCLLEGRSK